MSEDTGGPAFPSADTHYPNGEIDYGRPGMTLRDYFIAHAPAEPQEWFTPTMPAPPALDRGWNYCAGCQTDDVCDGGADCEKLNDYYRQLGDRKKETKKQRYTQWPAAWADAMIAERNKL